MTTLLAFVLVTFAVMVVTAAHLHLTSRPVVPRTVRTMDEIDAEFFRIIEREGLRA